MQIIVDVTMKDKDRNSFVAAIRNECTKEDIKCEIVEVSNQRDTFKIDWNKPTVVAKPFKFIYPNDYLDVDDNSTAKVILNITEQFTPSNVLVVNRSELIGKKLALGLLDQDHTVTTAHSKTNQITLNHHVWLNNILIFAANKPIEALTSYIITDVLIDTSGCIPKATEFKAKYYYGPREIGKLTVKNIIRNVRKYE